MKTNDATAAAVLKNNELFSALPAECVEQIARLAIRRSYPKGQLLFAQGDKGDAFYGVVSGRVRISASAANGKQINLIDIGPSGTFGEIALIDGGPRTASAITATEVTLFVIQRSGFLSLLREEPELVMQLLQRMCERVRWTSELVEDISFLNLPAQIAKRVLLLASSHGKQCEQGIELTLSQVDLAAFLGLSRQIVNQHLQEWRKQEWIDLGRGRILIRDMESLRGVSVRSP
jgi:CRP/FNR family cyclic AMP-dependent transcriptional regulator